MCLTNGLQIEDNSCFRRLCVTPSGQGGLLTFKLLYWSNISCSVMRKFSIVATGGPGACSGKFFFAINTWYVVEGSCLEPLHFLEDGLKFSHCISEDGFICVRQLWDWFSYPPLFSRWYIFVKNLRCKFLFVLLLGILTIWITSFLVCLIRHKSLSFWTHDTSSLFAQQKLPIRSPKFELIHIGFLYLWDTQVLSPPLLINSKD